MELQSQQPTISIFQAAGMLFTNPVKAFTLIIEQWHGIQPVILFVLYGLLVGLNGVGLADGNAFPIVMLLGIGVIGILTGWFSLYIVAWLTQQGNRKFGAQTNVDHLITAFSLAAIPATLFHGFLFIGNVIAYSVDTYPLIPKELVNGLKIVATLYSLALMCLANYTISKLTLVKSILVILLPLTVVYGIVLLLLILLVGSTQ